MDTRLPRAVVVVESRGQATNICDRRDRIACVTVSHAARIGARKLVRFNLKALRNSRTAVEVE